MDFVPQPSVSLGSLYASPRLPPDQLLDIEAGSTAPVDFATSVVLLVWRLVVPVVGVTLSVAEIVVVLDADSLISLVGRLVVLDASWVEVLTLGMSVQVRLGLPWIRREIRTACGDVLYRQSCKQHREISNELHSNGCF